MAPKKNTHPKAAAALAIPEPAAKKAKTDAEDSPQPAAETAEPDVATEKEKDAPAEKRPGIKGAVGFEPAETTLNVVQTSGGRVLMTLAEGGMQYLIAGARANVGLKTGRHLFEIKPIEFLNPFEGSIHGGRPPQPRHLVRVGFSTSGSSLLLGDGDDSLYFDMEGSLYSDRKRAVGVTPRWGRDSVVAVLLNLDPQSANVNTVSLFLNGQRACEPQLMPQALKGKTLFPHVSYRNMTMQVNFGPELLRHLPFKCKMVQEAAGADVERPALTVPKDGKCDVLFPVGYPDEGTFAWLDAFLEKNPHYVELSDRKIIDWATKSGVHRKGNWIASGDKPGFNYGLQTMDDLSVFKVVNMVAPVLPRNYVVMEVKQNLVAADRKATIKRFSASHFKRIAHVVMGEPDTEHKDKVRNKLLAAKQDKLNDTWKRTKEERERKRRALKRQQEVQEIRRKAEEARKKAAEKAEEARKEAAEERSKQEAEKAAEAAGKVKEVEEKKDAGGEQKPADGEEKAAKDEDMKEEVKKDEEMKEEQEVEAEEPREEDDDDGEPETATLTEEEEKIFFPQGQVPDLSIQATDASFAEWSIPQADEGFDAVKFEWADAKTCEEYLRQKVLERKRISRIETLQPGPWFKEQLLVWSQKLIDWKGKQRAAKDDGKTKTSEEEENESIDIFTVEDVCDVGNGIPLFLSFAPEDWMLCLVRHELCLLALAFKKDVNDPDRERIPAQHIAYYYNKYFRKQLNPKMYAMETFSDLVEMVKEAAEIEADYLIAKLPEENLADVCLKLTESSRRERERRIDAGDETARLSFSAPPPGPPGGHLPPPQRATFPASRVAPVGPGYPARVPVKVPVKGGGKFRGR